MANLAEEWDVLRAAAVRHGIDPFFLAAIRLTENGGVGRELGIMDADANSLEKQASYCANTVAHYLEDYSGNPLIRSHRGDGTHYICYSLAFVHYCGNRYAPANVDNDPNGLNKNWVPNMIATYFDFIEGQIDPLGTWSNA